MLQGCRDKNGYMNLFPPKPHWWTEYDKKVYKAQLYAERQALIEEIEMLELEESMRKITLKN